MHSACGKQPHAGHFNYIGSPPSLTVSEKNTAEASEFSLYDRRTKKTSALSYNCASGRPIDDEENTESWFTHQKCKCKLRSPPILNSGIHWFPISLPNRLASATHPIANRKFAPRNACFIGRNRVSSLQRMILTISFTRPVFVKATACKEGLQSILWQLVAF